MGDHHAVIRATKIPMIHGKKRRYKLVSVHRGLKQNSQTSELVSLN